MKEFMLNMLGLLWSKWEMTAVLQTASKTLASAYIRTFMSRFDSNLV